MIDEKKLIDELSKNSIFEKITVGEETVYDIINRQPKVNEWIPCSERLPEDNEKAEYYDSVIVTLENGRVVDGCYRNHDKEWWVDAEDGERYSINATGHVIAWMPLPERYNADRKKV